MIFSQFGVPFKDKKPEVNVSQSSRLTFFSNIKLKKRISTLRQDNTKSEMFEKNYNRQNQIIFHVSKASNNKESIDCDFQREPYYKKNTLRHHNCVNLPKISDGIPKQLTGLSIDNLRDFRCSTKYLELTDAASDYSNFDPVLSAYAQTSNMRQKVNTNSVCVQTVESESLLSLPSCTNKSKKFSSPMFKNKSLAGNFQSTKGKTLQLYSKEDSSQLNLLTPNEANHVYNKIFNKKSANHFKSLISKHQLGDFQRGGIITSKTVSKYLHEFASKSKDNQRIIEIKEKLQFYNALIDYSLPILKQRLIKNEAGEHKINEREAELNLRINENSRKLASKKLAAGKLSILI